MDTRNYADINAKIIDRWVRDGWEWGVPIDHEAYTKAKNGDWDVFLTPIIPVPKTWFPGLRDIRLLGLASGGGQQMPVFAAQGARCTVLDYADSQLAGEKMVAEWEGYSMDMVKADMSKPLPFETAFSA
ncbi:hypothetical protein AGMMS49587_12800 [Spirochaetia bacterium]|nr:hypothetical protein AGMMS49587_12800 [Spirochaetia bacterium]